MLDIIRQNKKIMNVVQDSILVKAINKLDVNEVNVNQIKNSSIILGVLDNILDKVQSFTHKFSKESFLLNFIDYALITLLTLILVSIPVAKTGIIGGLTLFAFLAYLAKLILVKGEKPLITAFDVPIFLYIGLAALAVTFSSLLIPSIKGYIKMLVYVGGYIAFINTLKGNPRRVLYFLGVLALTSSLEAVYAIHQQIVGIDALAAWQDRSNLNPEDIMDRVYGSLQPFNPNLLAGYLVAAFPSSLGLAFLFLKRKNIRLSLVSFIASFLVLIAIVFTASRGAYVATASMLAVFAAISGHIIYNDYKENKILKGLWKYSLIFGFLSILGFIAVSPAIQHRISSIFASRDDSSNSFRFNVYLSAFKMGIDNWLTGIGIGNKTFRLTYGLYMTTGYDALSAYNIMLEIFVEMGILGLFAFMWLFTLAFIKSIKSIISSISIENKIIISTCIIAITGMLVHGMFDTIWFRPQINVIFWLLIAVLAVTTHKGIKNEEQ